MFPAQPNQHIPHDPRAGDVAALMEKLAAKYSMPSTTILIESGLRALWDAFQGFESVKGKKLLDLGCGGSGSLDNEAQWGTPWETIFDPWLCRAFLQLEGIPVGIDLFGDPNEPFEVRKLDLAKPGALDCFPDQSFDCINMRLFLSSIQLARTYDRLERIAIGENLRKDCARLLKRDGKIVIWDTSVDEL